MSDLPSVFANKIDREIKNNEEFFHKDREVVREKKDIRDIRRYFDSNGYANKLLVHIKTKNGESNEKIILYKDTYLININNEKIYFKDIEDYEVK